MARPVLTRLAVLLSIGVVVFGAASAHAQEGSLAEALFRQARAEMKEGDYASSCPKLAESQRLDPAPGTLLNLAICEEKLGHLASAWTHYRELVDTTLPGDQRRALATEHIAALEPQLPRLVVSIEGSEVSRVLLDGVELRGASLGLAMPVDPGEHRIALLNGAERLGETVVHVSPGERRELAMKASAPSPKRPATPHVVTLPPAKPSAVPVKNRASEQGSGMRRAGILLGAGGLAGLATAATFTALAIGRLSTIDDNCTGHSCNPDGLDAAAQGRTYLRVADIALVIGAVGVATGGVLIWQSMQTTVRAAAGPNTAGVSVAVVLQ